LIWYEAIDEFISRYEEQQNVADTIVAELESGRFDSVHPAPYFIADISFGL